jgi:hypothetical protein
MLNILFKHTMFMPNSLENNRKIVIKFKEFNDEYCIFTRNLKKIKDNKDFKEYYLINLKNTNILYEIGTIGHAWDNMKYEWHINGIDNKHYKWRQIPDSMVTNEQKIYFDILQKYIDYENELNNI